MAMDKAACLSGCAEMLVPLIETKKKKKTFRLPCSMALCFEVLALELHPEEQWNM